MSQLRNCYVVQAYLNSEDNSVIVTGRHEDSLIAGCTPTPPELHKAVCSCVEKGGVTVPWFVNAAKAPASALSLLVHEAGFNKLEKVGKKLQVINELRSRGYNVMNKRFS